MAPFGSHGDVLSAGTRDWLLADFAASGNYTDVELQRFFCSIDTYLSRQASLYLMFYSVFFNHGRTGNFRPWSN